MRTRALELVHRPRRQTPAASAAHGKRSSRHEEVPAVYEEHCRMMCDLMVLAFQTDVTRIATFMLAREGSDFQYRNLGIREGHHESTHHRGDKRLIENVCKINKSPRRTIRVLPGQVEIDQGRRRHAARQQHDRGTAAASKMAAACTHTLPYRRCWPAKGGGTLEDGPAPPISQGRRSLSNLWLAMLERMGAHTSKLGDSTGILEGLS